MKYPQNQYVILVEKIKILSNYIDVATLSPSQLHYLVYQQLCETQPHNKLIVTKDGLKRKFTLDSDGELLENSEGAELFETNNGFMLYPDGCNDKHIETAVKKAIKEIKNS